MDDAKTEVLAFTAFPRAHWTKIWSNNPLERLNQEIKRRAAGRRDLPQRAPPSSASSAPSWPTPTTNGRSHDRRYLSEASMALLYPTAILTSAAITSGP